MTPDLAAEIVAWLNAGMPERPEAAHETNPQGQYTVAACLEALAYRKPSLLDRLRRRTRWTDL